MRKAHTGNYLYHFIKAVMVKHQPYLICADSSITFCMGIVSGGHGTSATKNSARDHKALWWSRSLGIWPECAMQCRAQAL